MNVFVMLVGVPGSGKSTWTENYGPSVNFKVVSSDAIIEKYAEEHGMTYDEAFPLMIKNSSKQVFEDIKKCVENKINIIHDQTNLTAKSRKGKLDLIPENWYRMAFVFPTPESEEWKIRLNRPGKTIPEYVLKSMQESFEAPSEEEGFDTVIYI